jgi:hypothetical protein
LAGCAKPEDDQTQRAVFSHVEAGEFEAVEAQLAPALRTADVRERLATLRAAILSAGELETSAQLTASAVTLHSTAPGASGRRVITLHQYTYPTQILLVDTRIWTPEGGAAQIENFHAQVVDRAQVRANIFVFQGKSVRQYAFFALAVGSMLLVVATIVGVLFTKGFRRKWLWVIISFVGVGKLVMVWNTGVASAQFLIFGVSVFGVQRGPSPLDPWTMTFMLPIGALVTLSLLYPRWAGLGSEQK